MKEYKAIIIDDERHIREGLSLMLAEHCPQIRLCGAAASAAEGRELLATSKADFIFLDISMPEEDGFDFLRSIPKEQYGIIFVTAFEEYAVPAIKANAIDYILKPVHPQELREAVTKAIKQHELRQTRADVRIVYYKSLDELDQQVLNEIPQNDKIMVEDLNGYRMVTASNLMYLEADGYNTILHFDGLEKIQATQTLGEFERLLEGHNFFRIHKSLLVNLNHVRSYSSSEGNIVELTDGTPLTVSRRKISEFRDIIKQI